MQLNFFIPFFDRKLQFTFFALLDPDLIRIQSGSGSGSTTLGKSILKHILSSDFHLFFYLLRRMVRCLFKVRGSGQWIFTYLHKEQRKSDFHE
jgi:hypothetical protein